MSSFISFLFLLLVSFASAQITPTFFIVKSKAPSQTKPARPVNILYHHGPILNGPKPINLYLFWYGKWSASQKSTIADFFYSFHANSERTMLKPSVLTWWSNMQRYKDAANKTVAKNIVLANQTSDTLYTLGKNLRRTSVEGLIMAAIQKRDLPIDPKGIYLVLTSSDVFVENFCMQSCAFHSSVNIGRSKVPIAWVGNPRVQCPGYCAWPFAYPGYGPHNSAHTPPNLDVGVDGMIINIATILVGAASNPFGTGYFGGQTFYPREAGTACSGVFGPNAYPGFPGDIFKNRWTNASFNVRGIGRRSFLLPGLWNPETSSCVNALTY